MSIQRLFIANRGEIAVRIIRAAQSLGIHTIQAYSEADAAMLAVRMADEAVCIGPPKASDSYLNLEAVVQAAKDSGADAVHPGYGFLAETPDFVRAVEAAGMIFVGPSADTIARMGDKVSARQAAEAAGVPVVPQAVSSTALASSVRRRADRKRGSVMVWSPRGGGALAERRQARAKCGGPV